LGAGLYVSRTDLPSAQGLLVLQRSTSRLNNELNLAELVLAWRLLLETEVKFVEFVLL